MLCSFWLPAVGILFFFYNHAFAKFINPDDHRRLKPSLSVFKVFVLSTIHCLKLRSPVAAVSGRNGHIVINDVRKLLYEVLFCQTYGFFFGYGGRTVVAAD